jgi:hypothetical protein
LVGGGASPVIDEAPADTGRRRAVTPLLVALVALLLASAFVVRNLADADWDPTVFVAFGTDDELNRQYATELLGPDIELRVGLGHDGRFFFAQANDPLLLDPETHAAVLDRPVYRSQRMLFPLVAGGAGLFAPWAVVWGMLAVGVGSLVAGTFATSLVAQGMGGSAWWGLAFGLNVGVISELTVGGGGHLGFALVMCSIAAIQRGHTGWSVAALTGAVLAREVLLISVAGIAVWLWQRSERKLALLHAFVPLGSVAAWAVYVRARIGWMTGISEVQEIGLPFVGFARAAARWPEYPMNMAVGIAIVVLLALFIRRALGSRWLVSYAAAGFVPLASLLTLQVWFSYYNITRAVVPVITAFLLVAFAARSAGVENVRART